MAPDPAQSATLTVARSRFAIDALARLIERRYGLTSARCQLIKGTIRDTYLVTSREGPRILSIYRHGARSPEEIIAELDLLEHLDSSGVAVALAIRMATGDRLMAIDAPEGLRHAVLFRFVPGAHLDRQATPALAGRFGRTIARMHLAADNLPARIARPELDLTRMMDRSIDAFAAVVTHRPDDIAWLRDLAGRLRPRLAGLPVKSPGYGMIHGDVIPSNAQVGPGGEIALLDFDFCGYGWRAIDVATYLGEARFWDAPEGSAEAFVEGYEAVRPLADWERDALTLLETTRHIVSLGTPAEHVNDWGSAYLSDTLVDAVLGALRLSAADLA